MHKLLPPIVLLTLALLAPGTVADPVDDALDLLVWENPPVACFVRSTTTCGVPLVICWAVYPANVALWALDLPPNAGSLPLPCLPPLA